MLNLREITNLFRKETPASNDGKVKDGDNKYIRTMLHVGVILQPPSALRGYK